MKRLQKLQQRYNFEVIEFKPYWQSLKLTYVIESVITYFPILSFIKPIIFMFSLGNITVTYNMGQTLLVVKKCDNS